MSTNDTVLLLASGASGVRPTQDELAAAVTPLCDDLAQQLIADAEGATKHIAIEVLGAASEDDAVEVGRASPATTWSRPRCSATTRTGDGSWPRSAPPRRPSSPTARRRDQRRLGVPGRRGRRQPGPGRPDRPGRAIEVHLHAGRTATIQTNDLSHAYVHENSAYST